MFARGLFHKGLVFSARRVKLYPSKNRRYDLRFGGVKKKSTYFRSEMIIMHREKFDMMSKLYISGI